jgi:hypothetical protein
MIKSKEISEKRDINLFLLEFPLWNGNEKSYQDLMSSAVKFKIDNLKKTQEKMNRALKIR